MPCGLWAMAQPRGRGRREVVRCAIGPPLAGGARRVTIVDGPWVTGLTGVWPGLVWYRPAGHGLVPGEQNGQICRAETFGDGVVPEDAEGGQENDRGPADEPSLNAIMAAIQDLRGSLEPKLDAVTVDVNLLRADLKEVAEKVTNAEPDIAQLQSTSKRLEDQPLYSTGPSREVAGDGAAREGALDLIGMQRPGWVGETTHGRDDDTHP
ncbi:hypothetical protein NDU88_008014 [Pleurodeles waltl]|uniref:Uncharacterized protein n=1 Tax=Pleurodeles waltl TaxID=8319 RepID=A0AAV7NXW5_PLEWA|nr:hypothetical protein NDU88_008014 [Pleurodeles waltl]